MSDRDVKPGNVPLTNPALPIHQVVAKILGYLDLKSGWDSYKAAPPTRGEVLLAADVARRISGDVDFDTVCPLSDGGVELYVMYEGRRYTISIGDDE